MKKKEKISIFIIIAVTLCLASSALILIFSSKKSKPLPELPPAEFTASSRSEEIRKPFCKIIKYPVLSDMKNSEAQAEINRILKDTEKNYCENTDISYEESDAVSYIIKELDFCFESGNFLSYKADGMFFVNDEFEKIFHSVNINTETGEIYDFDDIVENAVKFEKAYFDGKFNAESDAATSSTKELLINYSPEHSIYPDVYFENGFFSVIAQVPEAYGGLFVFKIPVREAEVFLNKNNPLVKFITTGES